MDDKDLEARPNCRQNNDLRVGAHVARQKIWKGRQELRVYFMNPEFFEKWSCRGERMNKNTVLAWAQKWNGNAADPEYEDIPRIKMIEKIERSDIRVLCSGKLFYIIHITYIHHSIQIYIYRHWWQLVKGGNGCRRR